MHSVAVPFSLCVCLFVVGDEIDEDGGERQAGDYDEDGHFHPNQIDMEPAALEQRMEAAQSCPRSRRLRHRTTVRLRAPLCDADWRAQDRSSPCRSSFVCASEPEDEHDSLTWMASASSPA